MYNKVCGALSVYCFSCGGVHYISKLQALAPLLIAHLF